MATLFNPILGFDPISGQRVCFVTYIPGCMAHADFPHSSPLGVHID